MFSTIIVIGNFNITLVVEVLHLLAVKALCFFRHYSSVVLAVRHQPFGLYLAMSSLLCSCFLLRLLYFLFFGANFSWVLCLCLCFNGISSLRRNPVIVQILSEWHQTAKPLTPNINNRLLQMISSLM